MLRRRWRKRPSEAAIQKEASNSRKLRWSKARVVSVTEKARIIVSCKIQGDERKRTTDEVSKTTKVTSKPGVLVNPG
jgi:competence transcription factor ComK